MKNERVYKMTFSSVYPLLVQKAEKKGRTKEEVDTVIYWLTGYDEAGLQNQIEKEVTFQTFFDEAPQINSNAGKITGVVCGVRVEEIGLLDDVILLPALVAIVIKLIPAEVFAQCRKEASDLWSEGKPKRWYYALPVVLIWGMIIFVIIKAIWL